MNDYAGDITPKQAWDILASDARALLIDVRTPAEWNYVGVPDLGSLGKQVIFVPWLFFPSMQINAEFASHVESVRPDPDAPLLFICRSGARSRSAAMAIAQRGYERCFNVAFGFEGDCDSARHRGTVSGWKADGLPWVQG